MTREEAIKTVSRVLLENSSPQHQVRVQKVAERIVDALLGQSERCPVCGGKGEVEVPHPSGYEEWGTILAKCRRCDGTESIPVRETTGTQEQGQDETRLWTHCTLRARSGRVPDVASSIDTRRIQTALNGFVDGWPRLGLSKVVVDGQWGPATKKLLREVRYLIGYLHDLDSLPDENFYRRIVHPQELRADWGQTNEVIRAGKKRRAARRRMVTRSRIRAWLKPGVGTFDGKPVAKCLIPVLTWCRANGWPGHLNSGYRSPAYSEHLCYEMCGAPSCPGRCAGRDSNHTGDTPEKCAADVSDYDIFKSVVAKCPLKPHIHNDLPSDPVHFSPSGH